MRKSEQKLVKNVKCIPGEECVSQHKLLISDMKISVPLLKRRKFTPKCRIWKLKQADVRANFEADAAQKFTTLSNDVSSVKDLWNSYQSVLKSADVAACGMSKNHNWRKETWWWNREVDALVKAKRKAWKIWKNGGSRDDYNRAKRNAKKAIYLAKRSAEDAKFECVSSNPTEIYKIARQMKSENQDVVGEKCILDDAGKLCVSDKDKMLAWEQHYERLSNVEFPWNEDDLPPAPAIHGPPMHIGLGMVVDAIKKMKSGKATGPSEIAGESIKAAGEPGAKHLHRLINAIIQETAVPLDWSGSYMINLFKGKGSALERGNHRGLKLIEHPMKVLERIMETLIRNSVDLDSMQFGFRPGRGTTDAIFITRQLQEKYLAKNRKLYFAFVDLEKAFDRVPRKVLWWALRRVGVEEWMVKVVACMYENAHSQIRVNGSYSNKVNINVGVHQGSVLSPLLFIIVLDALSTEFRTGCPWELLYADDLVITAENPEVLESKLKEWKVNLEKKGLRVNMAKTKVLISGTGLDTLKDAGRFPCGVCRQGVGGNSILCSGCNCWVHHRCSGISGRLVEDPEFKCKRCLGAARPIDNRPMVDFSIGDDVLEVVDSFCYLGDSICAGGGCQRAITTRIRCAWGKFRELLPLLTSKSLSFHRRGHLFGTCVRRALLHAAECWPTTKKDMDRIRRTDRSMLRWMCNVRLSDRVPVISLLQKLKLPAIESLVRGSRLSWYGHVTRSSDWINQVTTMSVEGITPRGRPKKSWQDVVNDDKIQWGLTNTDPLDRGAWRQAVRSRTRPVEPAEEWNQRR